jgi:hypothetical protein
MSMISTSHLTRKAMNMSINWAALVGLLLFLFWLVAAPSAIAQIIFNLTRRSDYSKVVIAKAVMQVLTAIGRVICIPIIAAVLFTQGWRLDPILQFASMLMALGIIIESSAAVATEYISWRQRKP